MTTPALTASLVAPKRHAGVIRSKVPLVVETPPERWAYAVSIALPRLTDDALYRPPLKVTATVLVHSGELGCLLVAADWGTSLGGPSPPLGQGRHAIDIFLERDSETAYLTFRNVGSGGRPCVVQIESVSVSTDQSLRFAWTNELDDVAPGVPPRIDVDRLRRAVVHRADPLADDLAVLDRLRRRWSIAAARHGPGRDIPERLALPDDALKRDWLEAHDTADGPLPAGPFPLDPEALRGRRVLEIGCGLGARGIELGRHGAHVTFVDLVRENLPLLERLCTAFDIVTADTLYLHDLSSLDALPREADVVLSDGLHSRVPFDFSRRLSAPLVRCLPPGGRWLERVYPRDRWIGDGSPPFRDWGAMTDGAAPWMEWYDAERLLRRLAPARFEPALETRAGDGSVWFDLRRRE